MAGESSAFCTGIRPEVCVPRTDLEADVMACNNL